MGKLFGSKPIITLLCCHRNKATLLRPVFILESTDLADIFKRLRDFCNSGATFISAIFVNLTQNFITKYLATVALIYHIDTVQDPFCKTSLPSYAQRFRDSHAIFYAHHTKANLISFINKQEKQNHWICHSVLNSFLVSRGCS